MPIKDGDDEAQTRVLFKGVSVFDRQQVAPIDGAEPEFAKTIDGLARQVEDVLRAASVPEAAAL